MASTQRTVEFLLEQIESAGPVSAKKMFSEYCIYCREKPVALVCDNELFVKPTDEGRKLLHEVVEKAPFPGAKMWFFVSGEYWEDRDWLADLIRTTEKQLPPPGEKKPRAKKK